MHPDKIGFSYHHASSVNYILVFKISSQDRRKSSHNLDVAPKMMDNPPKFMQM